MKYIECPDVYTITEDWTSLSVFMGGGITSCPLWQDEMKELLKNDTHLVLVNPRRSDFDVTDPNMGKAQIYWEHDHLNKTDAIMFWFPKETLCPITLFELGVHGATGRNIFVGCHPEYQRKLDVEVQLQLMRPEVVVVDSLEKLAAQITGWVDDTLDIQSKYDQNTTQNV